MRICLTGGSDFVSVLVFAALGESPWASLGVFVCKKKRSLQKDYDGS